MSLQNTASQPPRCIQRCGSSATGASGIAAWWAANSVSKRFAEQRRNGRQQAAFARSQRLVHQGVQLGELCARRGSTGTISPAPFARRGPMTAFMSRWWAA